MRFIHFALLTLTLAGTATLASAATAFAQTPNITVTPNPRGRENVIITANCGTVRPRRQL